MKRKHETEETLGSRLMAALFSLFVSVPTAALIWLGVNRELAFWGGFVSSSYLLVSVVIFALIAFAAPPAVSQSAWQNLARHDQRQSLVRLVACDLTQPTPGHR